MEHCRKWISNVPVWKDKDSVRIGKITRDQQAETRTVRGKTMIVRPYYAGVNAKNSYGGYGGERTFVCYADAAETQVVDLFEPGNM
jgi:hypothetical protein